MFLLQAAVFRADNRLSREIRPISFAVDTTPAADGSATCEMGLTVVQVAIYGPREPKRAGQAGAGGGSSAAGPGPEGAARVEVECNVAGFVAGERRKRTKGDRLVLFSRMEHTLVTYCELLVLMPFLLVFIHACPCDHRHKTNSRNGSGYQEHFRTHHHDTPLPSFSN